MKRLLALVCAAVAWMGAPAARGLCLALFVLAPFGVALAQEKPATPPPQVDELVRLLDDPAVRAWLDSVRGQPPGASEAAAPASVESEASMSLALQLSRMRAHLQGVAAAVPGLPAEIAQAWAVLKQDLAGRSFAGLLVLIAAFVVFGMGSEHAFWWATRRTRAWIGGHPLATVPQRLRMIGMRLAYGLVLVAIFGIGSVGAFLLFDWPPVLRVLVLGVLMAVLIVRFALILGRVLLVPGGRWLQEPDRYRVIPMTTEEARYWQTRLAAFVGYFAFGWVVVGLLHPLGFTPPMRMAAAYLLGLGLLAIGLVTLWDGRIARPGRAASAAPPSARS